MGVGPKGFALPGQDKTWSGSRPAYETRPRPGDPLGTRGGAPSRRLRRSGGPEEPRGKPSAAYLAELLHDHGTHRCQATSGIDPPATPKTDPPKKRRMLLKWWVFR